MQEDHVSMGWNAARKLRQAVDGLARVLAIEILTAARGIDLRSPLQPGRATGAAIAVLREQVDGPGPDRFLAPDIEATYQLVASGALVAAAYCAADEVAELVEAVFDRPLRFELVQGATFSYGGSGGGPLRTTTRSGASRELMTRRAHPAGLPLGALLADRGAAADADEHLDPEVAERPEDLVVYGGTGRAARSWAAFDAIVDTLRDLRSDETLLVQSGKPVGVFRTHEWAPRVLIANSNLVGDWATWEHFRKLESEGLMMYGQMTAGSWIYIGTQGILQGTFETFGAVARKRFGGTLAGTLTLTAGCGGMGGAQPLAVTMNEGVVLIVDVDAARLARRVEHGYLDEYTDDYATAVARVLAAKAERRPLSVGLVGNAAEVFPRLLADEVAIESSSPTRPVPTTR